MAPKKSGQPVAVENYKHDETRPNLPTGELREFAPDPVAPQTLLYPRNPDLDPQFVWKGKDDQDRHDLEVPVVPAYIQEKIQPRAIIEDLGAVSKLTTRPSAVPSVPSRPARRMGNGLPIPGSVPHPACAQPRHIRSVQSGA